VSFRQSICSKAFFVIGFSALQTGPDAAIRRLTRVPHCVRIWLSALLMVGVAVPIDACELPDERPSFVEATPRADFDTARFAAKVQEALDGRVMGYAVTLRSRSGTIIAQINHGYAHSPCEEDGARRFNGRTDAPIGSVSKIFTASVAIGRSERLDSVSLDDPFRDYLPERWRRSLHTSLHHVTLRQLMGHRGGFGHSGRTLFGRSFSFQDRLQLGAESYLVRARNMALDKSDCIPELDVAASPPLFDRCYANASLSLWVYSAASIRPQAWQEIEDGWSPGEIDYDSYIRVHAERFYRQEVQRQILAPAGASAGCDEYSDVARGALIYDGPDDERGKDLTSTGASCAVGGWFMSAQNLTAAVHHLVTTRDVIDANHHLMFANSAQRLVFFSARRVSNGLAVWHGGSRGGGSARAEAMVFPTGMVAAVIVNSRSVGAGPDLDDMLLEAYDAAIE
jgi:CubicO group peptidase (beta-lactamase class C family)